jgi:hypothetical protein
MDSAVATLGETLPSSYSLTSTKQICRSLLLRGDLRQDPAWENDPLTPPRLVRHRPSPDASCASLRWSWCGCAADSVGGRAGVSRSSPGGVAPRAATAALVKSSPGRASTASPCRPSRHLGDGEHLLLLSATLYSLLPPASDHLVMIWCSKLPT